MDAKLRAWLALSMTPGIGPAKFAKVLQIVSPQYLAKLPQVELVQLGFTNKQAGFFTRTYQEDANKQGRLFKLEAWLSERDSHHCIAQYDERYPPLLKEAPAAPPLLFVDGDASVLGSKQLAIVGSRNASFDGQRIAKGFAKSLAEQGIAVTSGLALGVDAQGHRGALEGKGKTIAVLGSGLNHIYPKGHLKLAEEIRDNGALVSELEPWTPPKAAHFPRRNRIISGLSLGVLIVEAASKSGSLITARYALEQNRDLFVVPGSIHSEQSVGSNALIRDGAVLVQDCEQLISHLNLNPLASSPMPLIKRPDNSGDLPYPLVLANLGVEPTPVDILAERTHINLQTLMTQLVELELSGHVAVVTGGYIRI